MYWQQSAALCHPFPRGANAVSSRRVCVCVCVCVEGEKGRDQWPCAKQVVQQIGAWAKHVLVFTAGVQHGSICFLPRSKHADQYSSSGNLSDDSLR